MDQQQVFIDCLESVLLQASLCFNVNERFFYFENDEFLASIAICATSFLNSVFIKKNVQITSEGVDFLYEKIQKELPFQIEFSIHIFSFTSPNFEYNKKILEDSISISKTEVCTLMIHHLRTPIKLIECENNITFHKVQSADDLVPLLSVMGDAYEYSQSNEYQERFHKAFNQPYISDSNILSECEYSEYYGTIFDPITKENIPCCCARLVKLSNTFLKRQKVPSEFIVENEEANNFFCIYALGTAKKYQNKGFGQAMVHFLLAEAQKLGGQYVGLHAIQHATEWYKKMGFEIVGKQWSIQKIITN